MKGSAVLGLAGGKHFLRPRVHQSFTAHTSREMTNVNEQLAPLAARPPLGATSLVAWAGLLARVEKKLERRCLLVD